ncbi:hypothetical protein BJ170DRAFT_451689 [Xylariales sp. AK1849]|nr:hypothetical protein BJ170DRAFT_451689 [Xylariales sp. AK1849]
MAKVNLSLVQPSTRQLHLHLYWAVYSSTTSPLLRNIPAHMQYGADLKVPPATGLDRGGTSIMRFVDFLHGKPAVMHRTVTHCFGVLIFGQFKITLGSAESKVLTHGDFVVQRAPIMRGGTRIPTETARRRFVVAPTMPSTINREQLGEHIELPEVTSEAARGESRLFSGIGGGWSTVAD